MTETHFLQAMAIEVRVVDGRTEGTAELKSSMWPLWSRRPRLGVLASFVDVVAGHVPDGPINPTVDLRVQVTGEVPETGRVDMIGRPLRVGRRLVVSETQLSHEGTRFATATATFINRPIGPSPFRQGGAGAPRADEVSSYEELVAPRVVEPGVVEVEPGPRVAGAAGTVQGGVQAFVAEVAAETLCDGVVEAVDLHIGYLSRLEQGPLLAVASRSGSVGELEAVRVRLSDAATDGTVAHVSLLMRRLDGDRDPGADSTGRP